MEWVSDVYTEPQRSVQQRAVKVRAGKGAAAHTVGSCYDRKGPDCSGPTIEMKPLPDAKQRSVRGVDDYTDSWGVNGKSR